MTTRTTGSHASYSCTRNRRDGAWIVAIALAITAAPAFALDVPPLGKHVNDHASLLTGVDSAALERKLSDYEQQTGHQFALLIVPTLAGEAIEHFGIRVAEQWKLGSATGDDGLIVIIVPNDRQMRIEVGHGLEGAIPDVASARIIREVLAPAFRSRQFAKGLDATFSRLMELAQAEDARGAAPPAHELERRQRAEVAVFLLFLGLMLLCVVVALVIAAVDERRARRRGSHDPRPPRDPLPPRERNATPPPITPHPSPSTPPRSRSAEPGWAVDRPSTRRRAADLEPAIDWFNSTPSSSLGSSDTSRDSDANIRGGGGTFGGGGASGSW